MNYNNKIKRAKSAIIFTKSNFQTHQKTQQIKYPSTTQQQSSNVNEKNPQIKFENKFSLIISPSHIKLGKIVSLTKQCHLFRQTIRKLSTNSSAKSIKSTSNNRLEYNTSTWRTINSARSLNRLKSIKKSNTNNPIFLNLQQKVDRIQSKHHQRQYQYDQKFKKPKQQFQMVSMKKYVQKQKQIKQKIHIIIQKWQQQKNTRLERYNEKLKNHKKSISTIAEINWVIQ